jgi:hypothetical protein
VTGILVCRQTAGPPEETLPGREQPGKPDGTNPNPAVRPAALVGLA